MVEYRSGSDIDSWIPAKVRQVKDNGKYFNVVLVGEPDTLKDHVPSYKIRVSSTAAAEGKNESSHQRFTV